MSFRWTHDGQFLVSRCLLCGHTTRERDQRAILDGQRAHDAFTCQMRRAENARANSPESQAAARKWAGYALRDARRGAADESVRLCCGSVELGVAQGRMLGNSETAPSVTSKPPLSTPTVYRKEAVDS